MKRARWCTCQFPPVTGVALTPLTLNSWAASPIFSANFWILKGWCYGKSSKTFTTSTTPSDHSPTLGTNTQQRPCKHIYTRTTTGRAQITLETWMQVAKALQDSSLTSLLHPLALSMALTSQRSMSPTDFIKKTQRGVIISNPWSNKSASTWITRCLSRLCAPSCLTAVLPVWPSHLFACN